MEMEMEIRTRTRWKHDSTFSMCLPVFVAKIELACEVVVLAFQTF